MTIKELEAILAKIEDKDMQIVKGVYHEDVNGYYFDVCNNANVMVLTRLHVQPRT